MVRICPGGNKRLSIPLCALVLISLTGLDCGSQRIEQDTGPLQRMAIDIAQRRGEQTLLLRFNPPSCPCPPWEVRLGERWVRAVLTGSGSAGDEALATLEQTASDKPGFHFSAYGDVDGRLRLDPQLNRPTVRLAVRSLQPPESNPIAD